MAPTILRWYEGLVKILRKVEELEVCPEGLSDACFAMIRKSEGEDTPLESETLFCTSCSLSAVGIRVPWHRKLIAPHHFLFSSCFGDCTTRSPHHSYHLELVRRLHHTIVTPFRYLALIRRSHHTIVVEAGTSE